MDSSFSKNDSESKTSKSSSGSVRNICHLSLSIWEKQVNNVVTQIKQAVTDIAQRFSVLTLDLEKAVSNSRKSTEEMHINGQNSSTTISDFFLQIEKELCLVLKALGDAQDSKSKLLKEIEDFGRFTNKLVSMSEQVSNNARMTNILSLNARVEAARNEKGGLGFAVVAEEVRDLSVNSAKIGKEISELVTTFDSAMALVIDHSKKNASEDESILLASKQTINDVMDKFKSLTCEMASSTKEMYETGSHIKDEISNMMVSLQFQDRVSQILEHIAQHMGTLGEKLDPNECLNEEENELEDWFEIMQVTYTTEEQKAAHFLNAPPSIVKVQANITFF